MKNWKAALCLLLSASSARAETVLRFTARVEGRSARRGSGASLVHCLAERGGHPWELDGSARGPLFLDVHAEGRELAGNYHKDGQDHPFRLHQGESEETCARLEPKSNSNQDLARLRPPPGRPELGAVAMPEEDEGSAGASKAKHTWLWVGAAALALGGGFVLWQRSRRPDYGSVSIH